MRPGMSRDSEAIGSWQYRAALSCIFLLSSALMIGAARGDLWLDEIWSLSFARSSHSLTDIFTQFRHDNNHVLNTLFLYCMGEQKTLWVYRLFSVVSGIGSVFLGAYIAKKNWGYPEALCSALLIATSYPLVLYYSEARGYAPAIFFALTAYAAFQQNLQQFGYGKLIVFWISSILGILAHSTFIMVSIAFAIGELADSRYIAGAFRQKLLRFMAHHALPFAFFAGWYMFFLKDMTIGGGPVYQKWDVIAQASALLIGFPETPGFMIGAIVSVVCFIIAGSVILYQEKDSQWLFFPSVLIFSPAMLLIMARPKFLYFRYFIICFPFFYLLFSHLMCKYLCLWKKYRWLLIAAVLILSSGQIWKISLLIGSGRGNYSGALTQIAEKSSEPVVLVGTDHDFRNRILFDFYAPRISGKTILRYVRQSDWHENPPDWLITHSQDPSYHPPNILSLKGIGDYFFVNEYRFSGISGWHWFLFRRKISTHS